MPEKVLEKEEHVVGQGARRLDAEAKVRGQARYADDLSFPGMLYVKAIRSEKPHARILSLDLSRVEAHPQVVCIVAPEDIPGENIVPIIYPVSYTHLTLPTKA